MHEKKIKIFLLDEDQNTGPRVVKILEAAGLVVKWFVLRSEMETSLRKELPDLFIVDPYFDQDEGLKFLGIRENDSLLKKIPVLALSSYFERQDIARLIAMGIKDYQLKPVNARLLLILIKRIKSKEHVKKFEFQNPEPAVAQVELTFTKISETSIVGESSVKLTDDDDGHYRIVSEDLESRGVLDECLSLTKNTTFVTQDGLFRAYFRMRGLQENVLQLIRSGKF